MAELLTELSTVKITTDTRGDVWYLDGCKLPKPTSLKVDEFLTSRAFPDGAAWRAPGLPRNARLLVGLHEAVRAGRASGLEVCSPLCCASPEQRDDPEVLLYNARGFSAVGSAGGWRRFEEPDLYAYRLADRYYNGCGDPVARHREFTSHPAYPALKFVAGLDEAAASALLGLVTDPRWYVDPANPDQANKLPQFLGLDPRAQAATRPDRAGRVGRNRVVLSCWKTGQPPHPEQLTPGQFVWKAWHAKGGGARGDLAGSKRFVDYLRQTWLSAVARDGHRGRLFVPGYFFDDAATAGAWVGYHGG